MDISTLGAAIAIAKSIPGSAGERAETAASLAEAAAQSVSQSASQITQNADDIADLRSSKASAIISSAAIVTGAVSSVSTNGWLPANICLALLAEAITNLYLFSAFSNNCTTVGSTNILYLLFIL